MALSSTQNEMLQHIHDISKVIFQKYNEIARTPLNWKEEIEHLKNNKHARAQWHYHTISVDTLISELKEIKEKFLNISHASETIYEKYAFIIAEATLHTAEIKLAYLLQLGNNIYPNINKHTSLYRLDRNNDDLETLFFKNTQDDSIRKLGQKFSNAILSPEEAKKILEDAIHDARRRLQNIITLPLDQKEKIIEAFNAKIYIKNDPSFLMRCITDPDTSEIHILLSSEKKYSAGLLRIGFFHEFCGHALESTIFDKVFVPENICHPIYAFAGVSSPNIFDVKSEGFADLMMSPFLSEEDAEFLNYRLNVWIPTRAYADWLYHVKKVSFAEIVNTFNAIGLKGFAFDESIMITLFFDGMQSTYYTGRKKLLDLQKQKNIDQKTFLSAILFAGKIPHDYLNQYLEEYLK